MTKGTASQNRIGISIGFDDADFDAAVVLAKGVPSHLADAFVTEFNRLFVSSNLVTSTRVEKNGALVVCQIGGVLEICARALAEATRHEGKPFAIAGADLTHMETHRVPPSDMQKCIDGIRRLMESDVAASRPNTRAKSAEFFKAALDSGGVSPWMTSEELSRRTPKSRSRRSGRFSALLIALSRLLPKSLGALLKAGRPKGWRAKK